MDASQRQSAAKGPQTTSNSKEQTLGLVQTQPGMDFCSFCYFSHAIIA
jgi:hypothetical protein